MDVRGAGVVLRGRLGLCGGLSCCEGRVGGVGGCMVVSICLLNVIDVDGGRWIGVGGIWWLTIWEVCVGWGCGVCAGRVPLCV